MAMLTSAFAYLGSFYGEANPSLQGSSRVADCALHTTNYVRTIALHGGKQGISRCHGQADLPAHWESNDNGCVSMTQNRTTCCLFPSGWHIVSAKVVHS